VPVALPSNLTKEDYAKYLLYTSLLGAIFAYGESLIRWDTSREADCGALQHWLGTVAKTGPGDTEKNNGRHEGAR
jgi:hypothetical protein